jgi:hypothetical protein
MRTISIGASPLLGSKSCWRTGPAGGARAGFAGPLITGTQIIQHYSFGRTSQMRTVPSDPQEARRWYAQSRTVERSRSGGKWPFRLRIRQGLAEIDEHDNARRGRHAESGDEPKPGGDGEGITEQPLQDQPAGECARNRRTGAVSTSYSLSLFAGRSGAAKGTPLRVSSQARRGVFENRLGHGAGRKKCPSSDAPRS